MIFHEIPIGCCSICSRWRKSSPRRASQDRCLEIERDTVLAERDAVRAERDAAQAEIEKLRLLIRQLQRGQFGRRSEKLDPDQLQLGLEDLEQTVAAAEAAQEAAGREERHPSAAPGPATQPGCLAGAPAAGRGRWSTSRTRAAPAAAGALHVIGEDTSEMLDIVPAQLRVKVIRRPRYGCRACEEAVVQAPAPERPITGGMATEALLAHVLVAKYADFLPLYRQAQIFARQGIELDRSTLVRLGRPGLLVAGAAVAPAAPARHELDPDLRRRHAACRCSTPAGAGPRPAGCGAMRSTTGPGAASTPPAVVYLYAEDRKGEHPAAHLAGFQGILQVDGYGGFKSLLENRPPGAIRLAFCWAHCRRRFYEIHQATGSPLAEEALRRIGELYADRGRDPRPPGRGAARGPAGAQQADRGGPARLAHRPAGAGLGQVQPGRGDPLRPAPLAGAGAVPRGRPARAGHQHHRAGDPADRPGAQE